MMRKRSPEVAKQRHEQTLKTFRQKVRALKTILTNNTLDKFPRRASISSFLSWDDRDLGVSPISRNVFYDPNHDEYIGLRKQAEHLLGQLKEARATQLKKTDSLADLRRRLKSAEARAQDYVNQYSIAQAKLTAAKDEIDRLHVKLRRCLAKQATIRPLRTV